MLSSRTVKPAPCLVSIKHSFHVLKHVIKHIAAMERALKVSSVHLLVSLKVTLEMSFIVGVRIVSKNVKAFEQIVKIKAEGLMEVAVAASRARSHLIVLLPALVI